MTLRRLAHDLALPVSILMVLTLSAGEAQDDISDAALQHAQELLRSTPLIDGHNDLPWLIREETGGDVAAFRLENENDFDTDIPRMREGMVGAQFWSVWIPGETAPGDRKDLQLQQIDTARQIIDTHPDTFELALTADDIERVFEEGKIASLLGMEGGYALNNSLDAIREFYGLGVRYMTLTHNVSTDWADAALGEPLHDGLTDFGRALVHEMNRTGMMLDIAHVSPATMHQTLDVTAAPVIWSHAASRALVDHPRNVPDDVLSRLPENGGVVMVSFIPSFLSTAVWEMEEGLWATDAAIETVRDYRDIWTAYDAEHGAVRASINDVADHIEHVRDVAGIDHVGIGSDFWGMPDMPIGLEDVSGFPRLFAVLIQRGWSDEDLRKLAGENLLRAMRRTEAVAKELQRRSAPSPYSGEESRSVKSLSRQEIEALKSGQGMGFAKLAELNHYPGPRHVLELADELDLSQIQRAETEALFEEMRMNAVLVGEKLLAAEMGLDHDFERGAVNSESLESALLEIGRLGAQLRYVHLAAHLQQKRLLTAEQIAKYDELRGYQDAAQGHPGHPIDDSTHH